MSGSDDAACPALRESGAVTTATAGAPADVPAEVIDWVRANAVALASADPTSSDHDLAPIGEMVGNARIVSLGEATHGTREFFQLKHRLLRYLATHKDFSLFGIEASCPDCMAVDEYGKGVRDDAETVLAGMRFWVWDTEEVLAQVIWLREHNDSVAPEHKVRWFGFDIQGSASAVHRLAALGYDVDPLSALSDDFIALNYQYLPSDITDATAAALEQLAKELAGAPQSPATDDARLLVDVLRQGEQRWRPADGAADGRDASMAANVRTVLEQHGPACRAVLWAHNLHAQKVLWTSGVKAMGSELAQTYDGDQVVVGFAFNQGGFQSVLLPGGRPERCLAPPARAGSLDAGLAAVGLPMFALDLRTVPREGPVHEWFTTAWSRNIGATWSEPIDDVSYIELDVRDSYDILIFVESTTASRPNPWVSTASRFSITQLDDPRNVDLRDGTTDWVITGTEGASPYDVTVDAADGSLTISRPTSPFEWGMADMTQRVDAARYRDSIVRLAADVSVEPNSATGGAYLFLLARGPDTPTPYLPPGSLAKVIAFATLREPVRQVQPQRYEVELAVPREAEGLQFGIVFAGNGTARAHDISLTKEPA